MKGLWYNTYIARLFQSSNLSAKRYKRANTNLFHVVQNFANANLHIMFIRITKIATSSDASSRRTQN